ncbi:uncharacterized protein LOC120353966 [Nilaparvata lugens]|uniref:uncharacterized protein LOC120353966 n=1 Tax=Nilaparvata lugens TaxID=108931 RepID=UPI00193D3542|nr:uncharacterized protein LOC120353966 [Nilaparvata lugens]
MAGIAPIINYVADSLPGSKMFNPNFFVLSIEVTRLLSSLLSSVVVDRLPRRTLLIGTSMICGCSMTLMSSLYLFDDFQKQNLSSLGINDHVEYMTNERDLIEVTTQLARLNANEFNIRVDDSSTISPSTEYNLSEISGNSQYENGVDNSRTISTPTKYNLSEISEENQYNHGVNNSRKISTTKYNLSEIPENNQYRNGVNNSRTIFTSTGHNLSEISVNSQYNHEVNNSRTISTTTKYNLSEISENSQYRNGVNNSRTIFRSTGHNLSEIPGNSQYNHGVENSGTILITTKYNLSGIPENSQHNVVDDTRTIFTSTKYNLSEGSENIQYNMNGGNHFEDFTKIEDNQKKLSKDIPNFLRWIPLTCIIIHGISFSFGVATVCSNIRSELFPMNVKGHCSAITSIVTAMTSFGLSRSFPMTRNFMGLWFNFGIYAVSSFLIALFAKFYLPETSGKTLQEIQDELKLKKSEKTEKRNCLGIV